jgi:hypothetical protein
MPQSFHPLNTEEKPTLSIRGEETTTPQIVRALNSYVLGIHVHSENTHFFINQLMECQLWCTPKFLIRPIWGSKYVELRKVGTWSHSRFPTLKGVRGAC